MTKEQAMKLYESNWWEGTDDRLIARFQLHEPRLCMPFARFHEAVEKALGRPVYTHEFAFPEHLRKELGGETLAPTFDEILALLPEQACVLVVQA